MEERWHHRGLGHAYDYIVQQTLNTHLFSPQEYALLGSGYLCNQKWGLAAHHSKANKEARLVGRKICFFWMPATGGGWGQTSVQRPTPPRLPGNQWARAFIGEGRGYMQKQHSQLWPSSWNWSCGGLTSVILSVFSTVNLQFQGRCFPISLRPTLRTVAAYVMATVWSSYN